MLRISSGDEKEIDVINKISVSTVTEIQNLFSNCQFNTSPPPPSNASGLYLKEFLVGKFPPGTWNDIPYSKGRALGNTQQGTRRCCLFRKRTVRISTYYLKFLVLTTVTWKNYVFWHVKTCRLRETYRLLAEPTASVFRIKNRGSSETAVNMY
jgi:hypothetical protein